MTAPKAMMLVLGLGLFTGISGCSDRIPTLSGDEPLPDDITGTTLEHFADASEVLVSANVFNAGTTAEDKPGLSIAEQIDGVLSSHALVTFGAFPDTIHVEGEVDSTFHYETSRVVALVPSESRESEEQPRLLLWAVEQPWDTATVTWDLAVDQPGNQVPWTEPGGTRGEFIGNVDWVPSDSAAVPDSLIWHVPGPVVERLASGDLQGLMITAEDGGRADISTLSMIVLLTPSSDPQNFMERVVGTGPQTFIFDPELPPVPENVLSVGGLRSDRTLLHFRLPEALPGCEPADQCAPIPLEDVPLNRIDLVLDPVPVAPGFGPADSVDILLRQVLEVDLGEQAPLGDIVPRSFTPIEPAAFDASDGEPVLVNIRELVERAIADAREEALKDDDPGTEIEGPIEISLAVVVEPEASHFGFAWFDRNPRLRFVYTLPRTPGLP